MDARSGAVETVRDNGFLWGGTWNDDGVMLLAQFGQLYRIDATGGEPSRVPLEDGLDATPQRIRPHFLPDGTHFLYFTPPPHGSGAVRVGSTETGESRYLLESDSKAIYAEGYLLFVRGGVLMAQRFDVDGLRVEDETYVIGQPLMSPAVVGRTDTPFSVSRNGTLAFRSRTGVDGRLVWYDRQGREQSRVPQPSSGEYVNPSLSPDGRWIAANRRDPATGNVDIGLIEVETNIASRSTSALSPEDDPVWSPDGRRIAFESLRDGHYGVWVKDVDGGEEELVWQPSGDRRGGLLLTDWSADGRYLLCFVGGDTMIVPVDGDGEPRVVLEDVFTDAGRVRTVHIYTARFSPDGEWIAYASSETGVFEIYVMRVDGRNKHRISDAGGIFPRWRGDGRELFYWGGASFVGPVMKVDIELGSSGVRATAPVPLFAPQIVGLFDSRTNYDVTADGERFLLRQASDDSSPITIIANWTALPHP